AQVGPQVAEKLGLTQVTYAEEILNVDKAAKKITVKRHIDGGVETVEAPLPIVITVNGSAAPCRPRNAKLVQKYKRALGAQEKAAITKEGAELAYAGLYEKYPYLNITEWSVADVNGDLAQCGLSGSPTKVKTIQNISFQAKESKTLTGSDKDVEDLIVELLANHTIG
ncbi:electron transfer flavoprotein beta subunit/FixA family protein, partial [Bacteroides uniformis]